MISKIKSWFSSWAESRKSAASTLKVTGPAVPDVLWLLTKPYGVQSVLVLYAADDPSRRIGVQLWKIERPLGLGGVYIRLTGVIVAGWPALDKHKHMVVLDYDISTSTGYLRKAQ